jgi:uncharacterized repeat protein (TIGR03806 family)
VTWRVDSWRGWLGSVALAVVVALGLAGCGKGCGGGQVHTFVEDPFPEKLSAWGLFQGTGWTLEPNVGVLPYELNTPLFSDYAEKYRTLWVPPGQAATYRESEAFELPEGTILSKTFMYPVGGSVPAAKEGQRTAGNVDKRYRLVETRILVRAKRGWVALPYVWNEEGTDATLEVVGTSLQVEATHVSGRKLSIDYAVPNVNQCQGCHERAKAMTPIGLQARHLNRDYPYDEGPENQLARLARVGYLKGAPEPGSAPRNAIWDAPATGTVEQRARAYLDANCAHCHDRQGPAASSALYLSAQESDRHAVGLCKAPVAAGRGAGKDLPFDIVPGRPERSILVYRMDSRDPGVMMPELGRALIHEEGVTLIREWIQQMQGTCDAESPQAMGG